MRDEERVPRVENRMSSRLRLSTMFMLLRRWFLVILALVGRLFVLRRGIPAAPERILVIKPDHLGDVLLVTPALRLLRYQYPQAHIVALVGPWSAPILSRNPHINAILTLPFPGFERAAARRSLLHPYSVLFSYAALLRAGNFDTTLLLRDDHWWGAALALLAGIPHRVGYSVPECHPFLTVALPWNPMQHVTIQALTVVVESGARERKQRPGASRTPHPSYSSMYAESEPVQWRANGHTWRSVLGQGIRLKANWYRTLGLHFEPPPADAAWAETWLAHHGLHPGSTTGHVEPRLVVLHPGTGGQTKLWLAEHWAAVGNALVEQYGVRLLLTGGPGEEPLVEAIARSLHPAPLTLVGETSVGQLAALLRRAALVMGVDSGPLHLAVSQQTPSLHLFGPSNYSRFGPWGDRHRHVVLRAGLWCSPCNLFSACPRHTDPPECMEHISVEEVLRAARRALDGA